MFLVVERTLDSYPVVVRQGPPREFSSNKCHRLVMTWCQLCAFRPTNEVYYKCRVGEDPLGGSGRAHVGPDPVTLDLGPKWLLEFNGEVMELLLGRVRGG